MQNNANRIVIAAAVALVAVVLVLVMGSGLNGGGGGGGSSAPVASTPSGQDQQQQDSTATQATKDTVNSGNQPEPYEELRDNLKKELSERQAPVGTNERSADETGAVHTVTTLASDLDDRGFAGAEAEASFAMNGDYLGETELGSSSTERYPSYRIGYSSAKGVEWVIVVNDGRFFAMPYGAEGVNLTKQIIFSETDYVTQYDGSTNSYSDFAFDQLGDTVGVKVARIDKSTLDSYTPQMIAGM